MSESSGTSYFSDLLDVLADRAKYSTLGRLGFANAPLRSHLSDLFGGAFGEKGAFLADPAFEAVFGWEKSNTTMEALANEGLLNKRLVSAMDSPPEDLVDEYRFPLQRSPYTHQEKAWRILGEKEPQSLVVASGTGSGKTECFLVPILNDLARERAKLESPLVGVRALFLYPLNALINSQRERLKAWTEGFDGDLRFALYNGNTPEALPARSRKESNAEVADRTSLRAAPPPILVTNATMLEYMLVRTADAPILEQSQGKLRWVVLDEAHTYVGSQAAEAALLIRRVLLAFGVRPDEVRFVATSATIGNPDGPSGDQLRQFLAEVGGVSHDRVHLVAGQRDIPELIGRVEGSGHGLADLAKIDSGELVSKARYEALEKHPVARSIRKLFLPSESPSPVARLSEVCDELKDSNGQSLREKQKDALEWLDLLSATQCPSAQKEGEAETFLPVRGHLFHQTLSGLWACSDCSCPGRAGTSLNDDGWPFGKVFLEPRKHCDCGAPVYELVSCDDCGEVGLLGAVGSKARLVHIPESAAIDEFELDVEPEESGEDQTSDEDHGTTAFYRVLIVNRPGEFVGDMHIHRETRDIVDVVPDSLEILVREEASEGLGCPFCRAVEQSHRTLFRSSRVGAPFVVSLVMPTLLEYAPDGDKPSSHPGRGRRLLTFNDSRQGTARMAARLQQESERRRVRGLVYHLVLQGGRQQASGEQKKLAHDIEQLESAFEATPNDVLLGMIEEKRKELGELSAAKPIEFNELASLLSTQGSDFNYMHRHYSSFAPGVFSEHSGPLELAKMFLVREFGRRPKRLNSLESMGLVSVEYPALANITSVPDEVQSITDFSVEEWHDFLKLLLDFFVRSGGALAIPQIWRAWLGMPFPQTQLVEASKVETGRFQRRWPSFSRGKHRNLIIRLLGRVLQLDMNSRMTEDRIDAILQAAWRDLNRVGLLRQSDDGRVLPIESLAFRVIDTAWVCPVTRRFLDTTLRGLTPYLPKEAVDRSSLCNKVVIPVYDRPFSDVSDDLERIRAAREWLSAQPEIRELRQQGLWSTLNDMVLELSLYYTAAEHSAQQDSKTLQEYEKRFKQGDVNLLSCSTTMEMGIDIGGISIIAMNNVPPQPSNYLQRAGRAGRRRERRSLALTVCKSNPHDQGVFANTRWPFDTPLSAPRVALDSPVIIARHINSFLLSSFFMSALKDSGEEQLKLNCGTFFIGEKSWAKKYSAWCRSGANNHVEDLEQGAAQICKHSVYDGYPLGRLLDMSASEIDAIASKWRRTQQNLLEEERQLVEEGSESDPAVRAVRMQKDRLEREYLLRELATEGFLPAYGFPTHITPFDNLTVDRFKREQRKRDEGREDNRFQRRELASRDIVTALREYAPGSEVVMDGLMYKSAGVTLNWHVPATEEGVREIQELRFAWRCSSCGASGSALSLREASHCAKCGAEIKNKDANLRRFLVPAGFSVDFYQTPSNDINTQHFVPVEQPWVDAEGDWTPLENPDLGRFRCTTRGHLFNQSRGIHGKGYALCLECGRAEPMTPDGDLPDVFSRAHRKLRRTKGGDLECPGSFDRWKIAEGITLGAEKWTDVLELQLRSVSGAWLTDDTTAISLAVALRDALAGQIGVQAQELGCDVKPASAPDGSVCRSILIYDRHAAGYASGAYRFIVELLRRATAHLDCPVNCDSACPHCILDFDQRFASDRLDRHAALQFLSGDWMASLALPEELRFFGEATRMEYKPLLEAIWLALSASAVEQIRFFVGGDASYWDLGPSPLREGLYRLASHGVNVEVIMPEGVVGELEEVDRDLLSGLVSHPRISMLVSDSTISAGRGRMIAEVMGKKECRVWAVEGSDSTSFGPEWADDPILVTQVANEPLDIQGRELTGVELCPAEPAQGDREIEIQDQLDGPLQQFGETFWQLLCDAHTPLRSVLADDRDELIGLVYRDRYLFTPIALALLAQIVDALRNKVSQGRFDVSKLEVYTCSVRPAGSSRAFKKLWADWSDTALRDEVARALFDYFGMPALIQSLSHHDVGHGRLLEMTFASGKQITVRFDQGVSYWRCARSAPRQLTFFDLNEQAPDWQAKRLAQLDVPMEGNPLPTQVFVKVR